MRKVARHYGVEPSTVSRWVRIDPTGGWRTIPTRSSRPHAHPHALAPDVVLRILALRKERKQCAEILQYQLQKEDVSVSLSSVKRTLKRHGLSRFSRWKKWHTYPSRPIAKKPGILVQIDTILDGAPAHGLRIYTLLDVCSRWAHAAPAEAANTAQSIRFLAAAELHAPFSFQTLQSDHGSEFSRRFTTRVLARGMSHRHSRIRTPNDNAHLERFNRTIQEECISRLSRNLRVWRKEIPEYLRYYNGERPHMGLDMLTPLEVLRRY